MPTLLPNGIELSDAWPPRGKNMSNSQPQPVPYLENPPEVVDVSIGRQLFVDDFLWEYNQTTMARVDHKPVKYPGNPILCPQSAEERHNDFPACAIAKSGGVWFDDADRKFKMWYMTGYLGYAALAVSDDGIHWERPHFDVVPGTNLILPTDIHPDSGSVVIDHETPDPAQRYKMLLREPNPITADHIPGRLLTSPDGVHWTQIGETGGMDDRSTMFYNPFRKQWVQSIRLWDRAAMRSRYYNESSDFLASGQWTRETMIPWMRTDNLDGGRFQPPQLYNFDSIAYESVMVGFFQILQGPPNQTGESIGLPKLTELHLATSRDGFHYYRPDRTPFLPARREYGSWEYGYVESSAGACLIVGDELWIYYSAYAGETERITENWRTNGTYGNGAVGLAKLRRDGFASMRPMFASLPNLQPTVQTRKLRFTGNTLWVNANTASSKLSVQVIDEAGKPIPGLTHDDCVGFLGNSTATPVRWKEKDLAGLGSRKVRLQFRMERGDLYSFWITSDPNGKSGGYIGAGGPGFSGARDL